MEIIADSVPLWRRLALIFAAIVSLSGCATPRFSRTAPGPYLDLYSSPGISTVHFPRGTYTLESSDGSGFYYRAPSSLTKHSFAGPQPYNGGIFVTRRQPPHLRGYIIWAAGLTKIGDLTRQPHAFHD